MATFTVTNTNDSGAGSLRQAILDSNALAGADEVLFASTISGQTINLQSGELVITDDLTINGDINNDGQADITVVPATIEYGNYSSQALRTFIIDDSNNEADKIVEIKGLNIGPEISGYGYQEGAGISNSEILTITNSSIRNLGSSFYQTALSNDGIATLYNSDIDIDAYADYGVIANSGTLNVTGGNLNANIGFGELYGNYSSISNSGIATFTKTSILVSEALGNFSGQITISGSTLSGSLLNSGGDASVEGSTITGGGSNRYLGWVGGGVRNTNGGNLTIANSSVIDNEVGGFYFYDDVYGGGVFNDSLSKATILNSTISGNRANGGYSDNYYYAPGTGFGGGVANFGELTISNTTISENIAIQDPDVPSSGGGLFNAGTTTLVSTLIAGNSATELEDIVNDGGIINASNSLIQFEDGQVNGTNINNIFGQDPLLDPNGLQNNGGPTLTIGLMSGSPAIDAGDNPLGLEYDQRGQGFPRVVGGQADIGAFEVQSDEPPIPSANPLLFSLNSKQTINGITAKNEDIVQFDGDEFSLFFDGSDVGLGAKSKAISAFDVIDDKQILISFKKNFWLKGFGKVNRSDVLLFEAESLGHRTRGSFSLYFDGSDVGLTKGDERIDGLTGLSDGNLLISTRGDLKAKGGYTARNEDVSLFEFKPNSTPHNTKGKFSKFFDGSDVGLGPNRVDAFSLDDSEKLLFSTNTPFSTNGLNAKREDVFAFEPTSLGTHTRGSFLDKLFFDGSEYGLRGNGVVGIDSTFSPI